MNLRDDTCWRVQTSAIQQLADLRWTSLFHFLLTIFSFALAAILKNCITYTHYDQCIGEVRQWITGTVHHRAPEPAPIDRHWVTDEQAPFTFLYLTSDCVMGAIVNHYAYKPYTYCMSGVWDEVHNGSRRWYMLESPKQCIPTAVRVEINKLIPVFAYGLQFCTGGHFEKSCMYSLWLMHRSETMDSWVNTPHSIQTSTKQ